MTLIAAVLLATVLVVSLSSTPPAQAQSRSKKVCSRSATVRDTPKGFVIARLSKGQKVVIIRPSAAKGWANIRTKSGLPGWILTRSLCK